MYKYITDVNGATESRSLDSHRLNAQNDYVLSHIHVQNGLTTRVLKYESFSLTEVSQKNRFTVIQVYNMRTRLQRSLKKPFIFFIKFSEIFYCA